MTVASSMVWLSQEVDRRLENRFRKLGAAIVRNPWPFLIIPVVVALGCGAGMATIKVENNNENLYTPQDARSFDDRDLVHSTFGFPLRTGFIYGIGGSSDLINQRDLLGWYDTYGNLTSIEVAKNGVQTFDTVCIKKDDVCRQASILSIWNYSRPFIASRTDAELRADYDDALAAGFITELDGTQIGLPLVAVRDESTGNVVGLQMLLYLKDDKVKIDGKSDDDPETVEWELAAYDQTIDRRHATSVSVYAWMRAKQDEEAAGAILRDQTLLQIGFVMLVLYATLVLSRQSPYSVHSHGSLALVSFALGGIAVLACFGLGLLLGLTFSTVVAVLAFLLLGLSVDDSFVIHAAFMEPELVDLDPEERVPEALARSGTSITVTSLTDIFAFLAGSYTDIPAIQAFCLFAALGVTFDYILQITAFVACLVLSHRREEAGRRDWLCCLKPGGNGEGKEKDNFDPKADEPVTRFIRDYYAPILLSVKGKVTVLVTTVALVSFSIWAATELEIDFEYESFVPDDSDFRDTIDVRNMYWGGEQIPVGFYTFQADYESEQVQTELGYLASNLNSGSLIEPGSCENWWEQYLNFVNDTEPTALLTSTVNSNYQVVSTARFNETLTNFISSDAGAPFSKLMIFDNNELTATEISCLLKSEENNMMYRIDQMTQCRSIAAVAPTMGTTAYEFRFLFIDGYLEIREQIFTNVGLALVAVFIVGIVLLGSFTAAFVVLLMIICVDVEVLGLLWYWGEYWNYVTGINLVLSIGLSVDANAHIAHSFLRASGTGNERAHSALTHIGRSVLNGVISTSLVLIPLIFSSSYIFQVFGKCVLGIMLHSAWHGLAVLPVVLSIVQPKSYGAIREQLAIDQDGAPKQKMWTDIPVQQDVHNVTLTQITEF